MRGFFENLITVLIFVAMFAACAHLMTHNVNTIDVVQILHDVRHEDEFFDRHDMSLADLEIGEGPKMKPGMIYYDFFSICEDTQVVEGSLSTYESPMRDPARVNIYLLENKLLVEAVWLNMIGGFYENDVDTELTLYHQGRDLYITTVLPLRNANERVTREFIKDTLVEIARVHNLIVELDL